MRANCALKLKMRIQVSCKILKKGSKKKVQFIEHWWIEVVETNQKILQISFKKQFQSFFSKLFPIFSFLLSSASFNSFLQDQINICKTAAATPKMECATQTHLDHVFRVEMVLASTTPTNTSKKRLKTMKIIFNCWPIKPEYWDTWTVSFPSTTQQFSGKKYLRSEILSRSNSRKNWILKEIPDFELSLNTEKKKSILFILHHNLVMRWLENFQHFVREREAGE